MDQPGNKNSLHLYRIKRTEHTIEVEACDKAVKTKRSLVTLVINPLPLLALGYIEEATIVALTIIATFEIAIYFWKIKNKKQ
jgi:ABC-type nitrate/sulfonate/bicarbonate transport system permease component